MQDQNTPRRLGVVGGLGALGAADVFFKLVKALPGRKGQEQPELLFEQHPFHEDDIPGERSASQNGRKLYVFDMIRRFEARQVDAVVLPCFLSHTFLDELASEIRLPIVSIMDALYHHVVQRHAGVRRLGVLTSDHVRAKALFERRFPGTDWEILYPRAEVQRECVMAAIYAADGIKAGCLQGGSTERLAAACRDLTEQGAELILPGFAEIPIVIDALLDCGFPVLDTNLIYARYAVSQDAMPRTRQFKVGVVGGVGPAATVDFVDKIVRNTAARRDQEHVKLVVEQNPQIPDRTEHLLGDGPDPTVALYSTCKKLEAADADIIAIPCNTAHAFVERIQPYLSIPVVNMLSETVAHIRKHFADRKVVGLLATSGTVRSGVYHDVVMRAGLQLLVPDDEHQDLVMGAIYGPAGVKAGFTEGACVQDLLRALTSLARRGAEVIVLGCTELPLLLHEDEAFAVAGKTVVVLDPTEILARKCVSLSRQSDA
ncbi:amino acid racemase [Aromatoleum toluolicum]|uniref:Amino acid racemase n=1 Tax=Aromatoleum toluolicum TaxID=90060 RepID=A0ABX1N9E6_9RHOO|nr:amino acid racemase [Aromatoleum toluolicum]NMF95889.1 amino acid racemase [Aromatoleum toluolicum]